jgi:hypothetical protein
MTAPILLFLVILASLVLGIGLSLFNRLTKQQSTRRGHDASEREDDWYWHANEAAPPGQGPPRQETEKQRSARAGR